MEQLITARLTLAGQHLVRTVEYEEWGPQECESEEFPMLMELCMALRTGNKSVGFYHEQVSSWFRKASDLWFDPEELTCYLDGDEVTKSNVVAESAGVFWEPWSRSEAWPSSVWRADYNSVATILPAGEVLMRLTVNESVRALPRMLPWYALDALWQPDEGSLSWRGFDSAWDACEFLTRNGFHTKHVEQGYKSFSDGRLAESAVAAYRSLGILWRLV